VERVPSEGRGKPAHSIPIRFVFTNKLTKDDRLLLAFDALVLSKALGREVSHGQIIHGDDHATLKVKTSALAGEVRKLTGRIATLLASQSPPDLVLNRHCAECEYQTRCRQKAIEKDDLSLLAGMTEKERKKHHSKGIFTVTQLSYTFRPRRRPKRQRDEDILPIKGKLGKEDLTVGQGYQPAGVTALITWP
jgi:predicted RecB family nuclease